MPDPHFYRGHLIKPERDRDFYVRWSDIAGAPAWTGTSEQALAKGCDPARLDRADKHGTSGLVPEWDDENIIVAALGLLPRDRIAAYSLTLLDGREAEAHAMLEPFDGEEGPDA